MSKTDQADPADRIKPVALGTALGERYLAYALSTITARSLPDVRDGLKPVQRRILYAMQQLHLDPAGGFKKCARVVGDVIGKFHPHGDVAVYDALVRLAQDFAQRYPLVDGQGNFGNVDGDNAAAMRYTESRLTAVAMALIEGIDQDTVDFRPTYDGTEHEPVVLPAAFPNLLANGASGIAVGMATSIPPHNAGELLQALALILERPKDAPLSTEELLRIIQGPDLPTGGLLVEPRENLIEAYATGRGSFRLRARWEEEKLGHGQYQIVVTEIPYQVQKSRLIERLAELLAQKKLPLVQDFRDESTDTVRIVFVPRARTVEAQLVMEQLFRLSDLETRLQLNMNVLDAQGIPRVMSLRQTLDAFIAHRMEVLGRRTSHRLAQIADRLEILEGYLKAFLDIDRVIKIIREEDEPKPVLMAAFDLTERQAEAILNLRLRNLRRLEEMALDRERKTLERERKSLDALLASETKRRHALREQMLATAGRFAKEPGWARRTGLAEAPVIDPELLEAPVERYPVTIVCSAKGWIRAVRGEARDQGELKYKEGDGERFILAAQSPDKLLLVATDGRCYLLPVDRLPGGRGMGEPLSLLVDLGKGAEILALMVHRPEGRLVLASREGRGFIALESEIAAQTKAGKQVVNLAEGDKLAVATSVEGSHVAVVGTNRKLLIFEVAELPVMSRGRGVILQRYKEARLADLRTLDPAQGLEWPQGDRTRQVKDLQPWLARRGTSGRMAPQGFPKSNRFG
jgi:topoisomerase-4 subunit A